MKKICIFLIVLYQLCFLTLVPARAQSVLEDEVKEMKSQLTGMQEKLNAYEQRIADLESQLAQQKSTPSQPMASTRAAVGKWTPEIGVVGDIVYTQDSAKVDEEGADRVSLRELELVLGSAVDPYSRLDATIAFSDTEEPSLEEAYLTNFALPWNITTRLGKFKPKVGKVLPIHRDSLDTVDEPLVIQRYFGVEGLNKSGVDFTKTLDLPWAVTHQVALGLLEGGNGEEGTAFGTVRRRPTLYGHLKNYLDVTDTTGLELGLSQMLGSRDEDSSFEVHVLGLDATLTQHINANQTLKLQGEAFHLDRKESLVEVDDGLGGTTFADADDSFWGTYALADFRFHPQWSTGVRYDYLEPVDAIISDSADEAYSGYLTFYQTEFSRWRLQFTHKDIAEAKDDNAVFLQGTFAIGDHKHKLQ